MEKDFSFKLINGTFTASDAARVLYDLISNKINFHTMENFSSQERFNIEAAHSQRRIKDLKEVQVTLKKIFDTAEKNDLQLKIESLVKITIV